MPVLMDIPYDCIGVILQYIQDFRSLCRLQSMCYLLWEMCQEEELWEAMCRMHLPTKDFLPLQEQSCRQGNHKRHHHSGNNILFVSWQRALQQYYQSKKTNVIVKFFELVQGSDVHRADALAPLRTLIDLSFREGGCIGTNGAVQLAPLLQQNTVLETLDLGGQLIRDTGMQSLQPPLSTCCNIQRLSLSRNKLANVTTLSKALKPLQSLKHLDLSDNILKGAENLCKFSDELLSTCVPHQLEVLILDGNPLGLNDSKGVGLDSLLAALLERPKAEDTLTGQPMSLLSLKNCSIESSSNIEKLVLKFLTAWNKKYGKPPTLKDVPDDEETMSGGKKFDLSTIVLNNYYFDRHDEEPAAGDKNEDLRTRLHRQRTLIQKQMKLGVTLKVDLRIRLTDGNYPSKEPVPSSEMEKHAPADANKIKMEIVQKWRAAEANPSDAVVLKVSGVEDSSCCIS